MPEIRPASPADLDACYEISLATGFEGGDASHLYADRRLMGHIYVAPYLLLAPTLAFVVEDRCGVAGFAVGTADTVAWETRLEHEWWPPLRKQYDDPAGIPPELRTADQRRAFMMHHPARTPPRVVDAFPAHLNLNLLPRLQRRGVGKRLLERWLEAASAHDARAAHVGVNRANTGARRFWATQAFVELWDEGLPEGRTIWMGRGEIVGNRARPGLRIGH